MEIKRKVQFQALTNNKTLEDDRQQ